METLNFTKMNGCGNDFIIVEKEEADKSDLSYDELARKICDRNFGVGADGLIIPYFPNRRTTDIEWIFYNSDGSTAQMCGNGMRCFAKYVVDKGLVDKKHFTVMTGAGVISPEVLDCGLVSVNMSKPILQPDLIPFDGENILNFEIEAKDKTFNANAISMGNPHCVIFTSEDVYEMASTYGPYIECNHIFPEKTNVEFVNIISREEIDFCVYERGCGITLACGTGACAAVVAGVLNNLTDCKVKVNLLGGVVTVDWSAYHLDKNSDIYLIGPADYNFYGEYIL